MVPPTHHSGLSTGVTLAGGLFTLNTTRCNLFTNSHFTFPFCSDPFFLSITPPRLFGMCFLIFPGISIISYVLSGAAFYVFLSRFAQYSTFALVFFAASIGGTFFLISCRPMSRNDRTHLLKCTGPIYKKLKAEYTQSSVIIESVDHPLQDRVDVRSRQKDYRIYD